MFPTCHGYRWSALTAAKASPSLSRDVHPDGLPHAYTIILMFRLLPDSPAEPFDLWQVSSKDHKPETGVTVNRKFALVWTRKIIGTRGFRVVTSPLLCSASRKTLSFYNKDERGEIQRVIFDGEQVKRIFHGSFHKVTFEMKRLRLKTA